MRLAVAEDAFVTAPVGSYFVGSGIAYGCIDAALCVIDRAQGGPEALTTEGVRLHALLTAEDLRGA